MSEVSYALHAGSIPAPATNGPVALLVAQLPCKEKVVGSTPTWSTHADVAQLEEASRSDRDQCRFDSCRQYQLDVAQWSAHRFREPGVGGSSPPVQTQCEMVEMEPCLALNQVVRVRVVLSQPSFDLLRR